MISHSMLRASYLQRMPPNVLEFQSPFSDATTGTLVVPILGRALLVSVPKVGWSVTSTDSRAGHVLPLSLKTARGSSVRNAVTGLCAPCTAIPEICSGTTEMLRNCLWLEKPAQGQSKAAGDHWKSYKGMHNKAGNRQASLLEYEAKLRYGC